MSLVIDILSGFVLFFLICFFFASGVITSYVGVGQGDRHVMDEHVVVSASNPQPSQFPGEPLMIIY